MSLNLGTPACDAAKTLQGNEQWRTIREAVFELARQRMNIALDSAPEHRADAVGYARAVRDLYLAFEAATTGAPMNRVVKPGMEKSSAAR